MTESRTDRNSSPWLAVALMILLAGTAIASRPLLPIDETRYMGVAWEMRISGNWLVPHLNGEPYSDKPPLLFWLINLVWMVTGVNETAGRLVSPALAAVSILLVGRIARQLWPDSPQAERCAPLILVSSYLWMFFSPLTMFDVLLTCCTLLAITGILQAAAGHTKSGWLLAGAAIGLGVLSKGPVILVHVMPAALLAPWWSLSARRRLLSWYGGVIAAIAIAAVIALTWALSAAQYGGAEYREDLLWGQTAGRVHQSFSHREPWWWYAPVLLLCLFPWVLFGTLWRNIRSPRHDRGVRFSLAWFIGTGVILSLVSGKQPYYLLPSIPAFALLAARWLTSAAADDDRPTIRAADSLVIRWGALLIGLLPLLFNHVPVFRGLRLANVCPDWTVVPLLVATLWTWRKPWRIGRSDMSAAIRDLAVNSVAVVCLLVICLRVNLWPGFDVRPLAEWVRGQQEQSVPVLWMTTYHDQLQFAGRLTIPLGEAETVEQAQEWLKANPDSIVLLRMPQEWVPAELGERINPEDLTRLTEVINSGPNAQPWYPRPAVVIHAVRIRSGLKRAVILALRAAPDDSL